MLRLKNEELRAEKLNEFTHWQRLTGKNIFKAKASSNLHTLNLLLKEMTNHIIDLDTTIHLKGFFLVFVEPKVMFKRFLKKVFLHTI